ncbi:MAG: 2-dehydropantoate 2-reductase [Spirochaetes bacterium]|nr:2-dehydropantoate 2-reductase [Spirochaetota bacterium]
MKIGIVGAGAMGLLHAAAFKKSGMDPAVYEKNNETCAAVKKGLTVESGNGKTTFVIDISDEPAILSECGIVFIFVKAYSTSGSMEDIKGQLSGSSIIVTLQNGLGNMEIISGHVGEDRTVYGTTTYGSHKSGPAVLVPGGNGETVLGCRNAASADLAVEILSAAGFTSSVTDDPDRAIWEKAIINAGINPIGALLSISNGRIIELEHASLLQERLIAECVDISGRAGIAFDPGKILEKTRDVCRKTSSNRCSMLQDISSGSGTEIDFINGKIIEKGREAGIPAPYNEAVYLLVKSMETGGGCGKDRPAARTNIS